MLASNWDIFLRNAPVTASHTHDSSVQMLLMPPAKQSAGGWACVGGALRVAAVAAVLLAAPPARDSAAADRLPPRLSSRVRSAAWH